MRFKKFAIALLLFSCGCSVFQREQPKETKSGFFVSVPVTFSTFNTPGLNIEIEERSLLAKLDLGFEGDLAIEKKILDAIASKEWIGEKIMYGVHGKEYKEKRYRVPKVKMGSLTFSPPIVQEENAEFLTDATFIQNPEDEVLRQEVGRVGWELFANACLFLDMRKGRIAVCDSIDSFKKEGYSIESFTKTPLLLERDLVEFEAMTPQGALRCVLDTGSTWNVLNETPGDIIECASLKIEGIDFGPTPFHQMPIRIPIKIDAILGMEFLKDNLVFLDFVKKEVYFAKAEK